MIPQKGVRPLLVVALLAGSVAQGGAPSALDVKVSARGAVEGYVVDQAGQPVGEAAVEFSKGRQRMARVLTDDQGRFAVTGLRAGPCVAKVQGVEVPLRIWEADAAPPHASAGVLLVHDQTVRGNGFEHLSSSRDRRGPAFGITEALMTAATIGGVIVIVTAVGS